MRATAWQASRQYELRRFHRCRHADDGKWRTRKQGYHPLNGEERCGAGEGYRSSVGGEVDGGTVTRHVTIPAPQFRGPEDIPPLLRGRGRVGNWCRRYARHRYYRLAFLAISGLPLGAGRVLGLGAQFGDVVGHLRPYFQNVLKRVALSSLYRTVCWMLR